MFIWILFLQNKQKNPTWATITTSASYAFTKQKGTIPTFCIFMCFFFLSNFTPLTFSYKCNCLLFQVTVKEQQDWKIPPCISNWKNAKVIRIQAYRFGSSPSLEKNRFFYVTCKNCHENLLLFSTRKPQGKIRR